MPGSRKTIDPLQVVDGCYLAVIEAVQSELNAIKNRLSESPANPKRIDAERSLQQRLYSALQETAQASSRSQDPAALQSVVLLWAMQGALARSEALLRSLQIWRLEISLVFRTDLRIVLKKISTQLESNSEEPVADPSATRQEIGQQIDRLRQRVFAGDLPATHKLQIDAMLNLFDDLAHSLYGLRFWRRFVDSGQPVKPIRNKKGKQ
ncbi:hypothetical protein JW992_15865 [candidate division KSB1 bacterium]|nr:hypothetical protein [candidate division KSB1 bacterium]